MTQTAATAHLTCRRCGRAIKSPRSIREALTNGGYGRGCARVIEANARNAALSETVTAEALELVEDGGAVQVTPAVWLTVSTDGATRYETNPDAGTCTCKSGQYGRLCHHLAAVAAILGVAPVAAPVVLRQPEDPFANVPNAA